MPELPEAEICRRNLERWALGRRVGRVEVLASSSVRSRRSSRPESGREAQVARWAADLEGQAVTGTSRWGKRIGIVLERDALLIHLGMTGRWTRRPERPERWTRLGLHLDAGEPLWFVDPRRFGYVVAETADGLEAALREGMGPDLLREPVSSEVLRSRLRGRRPVKVALMDQAVVAGLGNIHAAEVLFLAGIAPDTPCAAVDDAAVARLAAVIPDWLRTIVTLEDGPELVYVTEGGPNPFAVYDREDEPCSRCGTPIVRTVLGGRSTYACPSCQPSP